MPTYEYQCASCGHQFEEFQKINDAPIKTCPKCHEDAVTKLVSATAFQLKGTGWYATDFRNKGKPQTENTKKDATEPKTDTEKKDQSKEKTSGGTNTTTKDSTD